MGRFHLLEEISDMGRIKEIDRKASGRRKRNPVVYLICEGSETEIRYFKKFRSRRCNIDIVPIPSEYFHNQTEPVENCEAAIKLLKKKDRLERYEKNNDVYEQLKVLQKDAIERAERRVLALERNNVEILTRESNPVTTVFRLVEYLNSKQ